MALKVIPVILCGGSGTRLWPASRADHPKQFLPLIDDRSLLQNTLLRALRICGCGAEDIVTVTLAAHAVRVKEQLAALHPAAGDHILCEPVARNTAAAVAYAAAYIRTTFGPDTALWVLPADHYIGDEDEMATAFRLALQASEDGYLSTFGIQPTRPETGYGYIRLGERLRGGDVYRAASFVEKPDLATAEEYLASGNYLWNSGMFLFSTMALLEEYERHAPDILEKAAMAHLLGRREPHAVGEYYAALPDLPFDKAIMEKSSRVAVVPCNPGWSDIGSWESLWELRKKDGDGNAIAGNAVCQDARDCLIQVEKRLIAIAGLENIVVIESGDTLLIANRRDAAALRALVGTLKNGNTGIASASA